MPLANIFLLCALVFLDTPSIRVFFQESQSQEARPKPDQAQEAPKAAQTEPSKPGQCATKSTPSGGKCKSPSSGPRKRIVRRGSTTDPTIQFSPGLTQQQASAQRQNTSQLLASTDANLRKISNRQLTPAQQDALNQIRRYMEQAKTADASGDLQRAHNLAFKARQLSDELLQK